MMPVVEDLVVGVARVPAPSGNSDDQPAAGNDDPRDLVEQRTWILDVLENVVEHRSLELPLAERQLVGLHGSRGKTLLSAKRDGAGVDVDSDSTRPEAQEITDPATDIDDASPQPAIQSWIKPVTPVVEAARAAFREIAKIFVVIRQLFSTRSRKLLAADCWRQLSGSKLEPGAILRVHSAAANNAVDKSESRLNRTPFTPVFTSSAFPSVSRRTQATPR